MKSIFAFIGLCLSFNLALSQVSTTDRHYFVDNLNAARKVKDLGVSPYSNSHISLTINGMTYNGIRAVSNKIMMLAYPNASLATIPNKFLGLANDKETFENFLLQLCIVNDGIRNRIIHSLKTFCGSEKIGRSIYTAYWPLHDDSILKKVNEKQDNSEKVKSEVQIDSSSVEPEKKEIYEEAEFPGGSAAVRKFLIHNIKMSDSAKIVGGNVTVEFTIDSTGKVLNPIILSPRIGYGMEEEVVRVVMLLPAWKAARRNGIQVATMRKQSITFAKNSY